MTKDLTAETFHAALRDAGKPVLIDFSATWCPPCKMQFPVLDEVAAAVGADALVAKVDVDADPELAAEYNVRSIPTLVVIRDGVVAKRFTGFTPKAQLLAALRLPA